MKIKVADLKANLSRHLRQLRQTGEVIEVCVREDSVAYLSPVHKKGAEEARAEDAMRLRLRRSGLILAKEGSPPAPLAPQSAAVAGDQRTDLSTVSALRAEKDW